MITIINKGQILRQKQILEIGPKTSHQQNKRELEKLKIRHFRQTNYSEN